MNKLIATLLVGLCVLMSSYVICKHYCPQIFYTAVTEEMATDLIDAHNKIRNSRGLSSVHYNEKLSLAAQHHAEYMASTNRLSHYGRGLSRPSDRVTKEGYLYWGVAENIAFGQQTIEEVMTDWMNSEGHRRNLLGDYQDVGVAIVANNRGQLYWCVVFGKPEVRQ
jgi:uncharacterized protein YkwD